MSFEKSGVEFVAKGLGGYLSDLNKANQAQQALGKSASGFSSSFGSASSAASGFGSRLSSLIPGVGGFVSSLGSMATIAGGIVTAQIFNKLAEGVGAFVSTGLEAVGNAQQLEVGLGALLTQNNLYERQTIKTTVAVGDFAKAQAEASEKAKDLQVELAYQQATIQEQKERIRQVTAQWGENGLETQQQIARLGQMERELEKTTQELSSLSNVQQEYATTTQTSYQQVREFGEAQALAATQTQELLAFVDKLSIVSPFEQDQVQLVTKFAVGAGLAVDEVKSFTSGFLDLAAAVGIGSAELAFASDQLLQVAKVGKITTVDLRQLRRLGIDLEKIISVEMGMTIEQFNAEAEKSPEIFNKLFNSVASFSEKTFGGAAQRMASTVAGLQSTLSDIFKVGAKNLLRPLVEAVGPVAADMLSRLSDVVTGPELSAIGQDIGATVSQGLEAINTAVTKVMGAFSRFGLRGATVSILGMLGLEQSQISTAMSAFDTITTAIDKVSRAFQNFGIRGATVSILGQLGMDPETIGMVKTTIDETITFITESFATISTIYQQFGAQGAAVSLLSILGFSSETIGTITTVVQTVIDTVNSLVDWWVTSWPIMQAAALTGWEIIKGIFAGFQNIATVVGAQLSLALNNITMALNKMGLDWGKVWDAVVQATGIVVAAIGVALLGIVAAITGVVTGVTGAVLAITETWAGLIDSAVQIVTGLATTWAGFVNLFNALVAGEWAAAWEAFKLVIQGGVTTISGLLQGMLTLFTGAFNTVVGLVGGFATGVIAVFTGLYDTLIGHSIIPDLINGITKWFRDLPQKIVNALTGMASKVLKPIQETAKGMVEAWKETDWVELGVSTVDGVLEGLKENAHLVWEFFKEMAQKAWSEMASSIGFGSPAREFMPLGQSMVQGLISGAQDQDFAAGFIDSLNMGTIARELGGGGSGWKEMRRIISQAIENNMGLLASGNTQAMMAVIGDTAAQFGFPPSVAQEFAQANGLLDGLSERYQEMMRVIRVEGLSTAVGLAGQFSGIAGSFAGMLEAQMGNFEEARRVYADFTKENEKLIQEFAKLTAESDKLNESMAKESERLEKLQIDLGQAEEKHRILGFEMALNRQKLEELNDELLAVTNEYGANSAEAEKVRDKIIATQIALDKQTVAYSEGEQKINEINAAIQEQSAALEELNQKLIDNKKAQEEATAAQAALKAQNLAKMFKTLTMGHGGLGPLAPLADQIAALQAFLDSGEATLSGQVWDDAMGEMANWSLDQVTAQAKLNELLAEQARKEEQILKAKEAQQKIDFLSQQVNLLKLIQDQGLNPADILGGITLGLNASIDDLLAATNSVVEAMIEQINQDLQISSPSKVMARIGKRITQGLGKGIEMGGGFVSKAMQRVPLMNLGGMMQPLTLNDRNASVAAAGPVNTSNYNFYQTVNSGASASAVTQQFEVARALLGT